MDHLAFWTILAGLLTGVSCALVGCFLVLRRMSLLGDAISHAVLPGIAVGFLLSGKISGPAIVLGAMTMGLLTAFLTQSITSATRVSEDASLGVVFTAFFALGVVLLTISAKGVDLDAGCVLYGLIEFIPFDTIEWNGLLIPRAIITLGFTLLLTGSVIALFWKELKLASFDPALATTLGYPASLLHYLLMALVAGVTVASFEAVGSILVVAMLVVPAAAAHLLTDRLGIMILIASLLASLSAIFGYLFALQYNTSVAGMMAVVAGGFFALALILAPRYGLLAKVLRQARLTLRIAREDLLGTLYRREEANQRGEQPAATSGRPDLLTGSRPLFRKLALRQLLHRGLVQGRADHYELTPAGRDRAIQLVRAHRLWEAYLEQNVSLPPDHLHAPAEKMEHYVGPNLLRELESALRQPATDPHGRTIPPSGPSPR